MGWITLWSGSGIISSDNYGKGKGRDMTIWYEKRNNMYAIKGHSYYSDGGGYHVGPQSTVPWATPDVRVRLTYSYKTMILTTQSQIIGKPGDFINYDVYIESYVDPPTTPSSISVTPSSVQEGSTINISWGTSSVSSGSITYYLERSIDGGAYSQIYSGSLRSRSQIALNTWNTVRYRVRSYANGDYSSYRTSSIVMVTHFPELKIEVDSALKTSDNGWCKIAGQLREVDRIWTRINGVLKEV